MRQLDDPKQWVKAAEERMYKAQQRLNEALLEHSNAQQALETARRWLYAENLRRDTLGPPKPTADQLYRARRDARPQKHQKHQKHESRSYTIIDDD